MENIILKLLESAPGIILLFIVSLSILALIIFAIIKVLPNIKSIGKGGIVMNGKKSKDFSFYIDDIVSNEYDKYITLKETLLSNISKELKNIQQLAVKRAIEYICLEIDDGAVNSSDENDFSSKLSHIIGLYLCKDLTEILVTRLSQIYESSTFLTKADFEINNEIEILTEDTVRSMKNKVREYILIKDAKNIIKLYDKATPKIRETIDDAIKNFIKLNKEQQSNLIKYKEERQQKIEQRIKELEKTEDIDKKED